MLAVVGSGLLLATACGSASGGAGVQSSKDTSVTVMAAAGTFQGLTAKSSAGVNSAASWYTYYHKVWATDLPNLKITELDVPDYTTIDTKTLLTENAGDPPDLISVATEVPQMVQRGELMNLDPFFKRAGINPSDFLGPMAQYARYGGSWYALPAASGPSDGDLLVIPKDLSAAGIDPSNLPRSWAQLFTDTEKVTKFGPGHSLERIGEPVLATSVYNIDLYCGTTVIWSAQKGYQADTPCVESFFNYEQRLVNFYGGWNAYNKFISGDPGVYSCSPKSYVATGKELFDIDAYWTGGQMDHCYNLNWELYYAPTLTGKGLNKGTQLTQWFMAIPKGAKHAQAAFDLWLTTFYKNGFLAGPTTNGYVRPDQASQWNKSLIQTQAGIRKSKGYPGNPMASALKVVSAEAVVSQVAYPRGTFTSQYSTIMGDAWSNIAYGKGSVSHELKVAQQQINTQEHNTPGGAAVS